MKLCFTELFSIGFFIPYSFFWFIHTVVCRNTVLPLTAGYGVKGGIQLV